MIGQALPELFHAPVEIAEDGLDAEDDLVVDGELQAEHAVGAGVLGPHVEVDLFKLHRFLPASGKSLRSGWPSKSSGM